MADPFIGEIRLFAGNYAPYGWAICAGQVMNVTENQALYAVIGNTYGGNPPYTFALPDLKARAPMHFGQGPGLIPHAIGEAGGNETVTVTTATMSGHTHRAQCTTTAATSSSPDNGIWAKSVGTNLYGINPPTTQMSPQALQAAGGGEAHNNMQPYLGIYFIIALQGIFPVRS